MKANPVEDKRPAGTKRKASLVNDIEEKPVAGVKRKATKVEVKLAR